MTNAAPASPARVLACSHVLRAGPYRAFRARLNRPNRVPWIQRTNRIAWIRRSTLLVAALTCTTVPLAASARAATTSTRPPGNESPGTPIASTPGTASTNAQAIETSLEVVSAAKARTLRELARTTSLVGRAVSRARLASGAVARRPRHHRRRHARPHRARRATAPLDPFAKGSVVDLVQWGPRARPRIASELAGLGANWDRVDLDWAATEPSPGVYHWAHMDAQVAVANAYGIHLLPVIGYAPSWTTPQDAQAYASFVAAVVKRYGPGTSANLTWFELWNEPTFAYAWSGGQAQPGTYAKDVRAAAEAAKRVAPSVKVLMYADYEDSPQTGGSSPWQTTMIDDYFAAVPDLAKWIDGIAVHPYGGDPSLPVVGAKGWKDRTGAWGFARVDQIHNRFLAHGADLPMWITEIGWSTYTYSTAEQAKRYYDLIGAVQRRPWIRALFAYCLREWESNPTNDQSGYGLLSFRTWQPKPAYEVLRAGFAALS